MTALMGLAVVCELLVVIGFLIHIYEELANIAASLKERR